MKEELNKSIKLILLCLMKDSVKRDNVKKNRIQCDGLRTGIHLDFTISLPQQTPTETYNRSSRWTRCNLGYDSI